MKTTQDWITLIAIAMEHHRIGNTAELERVIDHIRQDGFNVGHKAGYDKGSERRPPSPPDHLTKREQVAAMVLPGIIAGVDNHGSIEDDVRAAIRYADTLLANSI